MGSLYGSNYDEQDPIPAYFNGDELKLAYLHFSVAIFGVLGSLFIIFVLWGKVRKLRGSERCKKFILICLIPFFLHTCKGKIVLTAEHSLWVSAT